MEEVWKPIEGHEEYFVSNLGRIKNINGYIMKTPINTHGYPAFHASKFGKKTNVIVHRAVAECFVERVEGKLHVNHIDGDKTNNNSENLEWCTPSENHFHRVHVLGKHPNYTIFVHASCPVRCKENGMEFSSCKDAANWAHGNDANISRCCRGIRKVHKGYHWEYI